MKKILYYGGLWPTNIGNSFIDLGALYLLKQACPDSQIYKSSRFSCFYAQHRKYSRNYFLRNEWKPLDVTYFANVDYVVVAGNVTHSEFVEVEGPLIKALTSRGVKFIILGGGSSIYTEDEYDTFRKFMDFVNVYAYISRDQQSYEQYNKKAIYSYAGIDCGFFLNDTYDPLPLNIGDYVVCSFDDQSLEYKLNLSPEEKVFRTRHYLFGIRERFIKKLNLTLVSDIPDDYLSLYANARAIYSDRVHACVAGLSFGTKVQLISKSVRASLFNEVGVHDINKKLVEIDIEYLNKKKTEEINYLSTIIT